MLAIALFATGPTLAVQAQAIAPAVLHGVVLDETGAPVPSANVAVYRDGNRMTQRETDTRGRFDFDGPAREYTVQIPSKGFDTLRSSPIPFSSTEVTHFVLHAASIVDAIEVPSGNAGIVHPTWEYGVLAQGGVGTGDRSGYKFLLLGGHAGKVLTPDLGSGYLKGNFEYAVEVFPLWQSYTPRFSKISCNAQPGAALGTYTCSQPYTVGGTYTGVSITPILLRWNLTHGQRWMPWLQGAGGVVWTNHKYPAIGNTNPLDLASNGPTGDTSVWNFTPQFGIGTHYFLRPKRSLDFSANAVHISSASLGDKNPGVNASVQVSAGYTWWK